MKTLTERLNSYALRAPLPLLEFWAKVVGTRGASRRFLRVKLLVGLAKKLAQTMKALDFRQGILVKGDGKIFVLSDGIFLAAIGSNRYFKVEAADSGNEASKMAEFLGKRGITDPRFVLDIGANCGEISLFFSRHFPRARILAVEASTENLQVFNQNLSSQFFPTDNIRIIQAALCDQDGSILITKGRKAQNSIVLDDRNPKWTKKINVEEVPALTLSTLLNREQIPEIDFIKIDIEGAEPLLYNDLEAWSDRIKALLIEFGSKNKPEAYMRFFDLFHKRGFEMYNRWTEERLANPTTAKTFFLSKEGDDFWFIHRQR